MAVSPPLEVGQIVSRAGYFGQAIFLRAQPTAAVEQRLGYRAGRMRLGWWLLFLTQMPKPEDFEVRGYSHFSGGVVQGHLPKPSDPRNTEQRLRDGGYDVVRIKQNLIRDTFTLTGAQRLAKAIPVAPTGNIGDGPEYPPGSGVPQWQLLENKALDWKVAAFIGPGQVYDGMYL